MSDANLVGNRVVLRPLVSADAAALAKCFEQGAWASLGYTSLMETDRGSDFAVMRRRDGRLIGAAGLHGIRAEDHTALLGMLIAEGDGANQPCLVEVATLLAGVAFERLGLNRVELVVTELQQRDLYACWGAGFEFEGRSRQAVYREGAFRDVMRYGLLRQRWEGLRGGKAAMA